MSPNPLVYVKFGLIGLVILLVGILAIMRLIEPTTAVTSIVGAVGALVVALGLSSAGQQIGQQTATALREHTSAMLAMSAAPDAVKRGTVRGFVTFRALAMMAGAGLLLLVAIFGCAEMLGCTKAQGAEIETVGENVAICVLNVTASDIAAGITDEGQIATDAIAKCIGANASPTQKAGVMRLLEASTSLRAARAPDGGR